MVAKQILIPLWLLVCQSAAGLEGALMPRRCVFCGLICVEGEHLICSGCDADLPRVPRRCPTCAQALGATHAEGIVCADCQVRPPPFEAAMAPLAYEFPVDAAIRMFKFRRRLYYAPAFGELLRRALAELPDDIDALLPVPLHWLRHGIRGFNQSAEMCRPIRDATGLPVVRNVSRVRATPYQSGLSAKERRRNLRRAFVVRGALQARHILIVDDVITTGETCRQLAVLLKKHGAQKISVLALARA